MAIMPTKRFCWNSPRSERAKAPTAPGAAIRNHNPRIIRSVVVADRDVVDPLSEMRHHTKGRGTGSGYQAVSELSCRTEPRGGGSDVPRQN